MCYGKNAASFVDILFILIKMKWHENKNEHGYANSMHVCVQFRVHTLTHSHKLIVHATSLIKHCTCDDIIFAQHDDDTFAYVQNHRFHFCFEKKKKNSMRSYSSFCLQLYYCTTSSINKTKYVQTIIKAREQKVALSDKKQDFSILLHRSI